MTTITKERIELFIKNPLENGLTRGEQMDLARIVLASLTAEPVLYAAEETLAYAKMGELHLTCLSEPMGDAVIPLCTAPPAPVVPDEWTIQDAVKFCRETGRQDAGSAMEAWNACRNAMLNGGKS
ncbi:TPA: Eaa protein [Salmonella enterica subsp. enterica serovar Newport]